MNWWLVGYCLVFGTAVFSVGSYVINKFKLTFDSGVETKIFAFALGCVTYSYWFLFLGALHLLTNQILLAGYILPIICLGWIKLKQKHFWRNSTINFGKEGMISIVLLVFILGPLVPNLFAFPTSWDTLAYHLTLPKLYLQDHTFKFYTDFPQTGYPVGIEGLFGYGEIFKEPRFGNMLNFSFLAATLIYLLWGLKKSFKYEVVFLAVLVFCLNPILYTEVAVTPMVDYGFAFFGLVMAISLGKFINKPDRKWLGTTLALAIFGATIKFTGYLFIGSLGITLWLIQRQNAQHKLFWKTIFKRKLYYFVILAVMLLPCIYWLGKNYLATHDPVYPMMTNVFKAIDYDKESFSSIFEQIKTQNILLGRTIQNLRLRVDGAEDYAYLAGLFYFGILVGLGAVVIILNKKTERYQGIFLLSTMVLIVLMVGPLYRYYLPVIPALVLLISNLVVIKLNNNKLLHAAVWGIFLLTVLWQLENTFLQRGKVFTDISKTGMLRAFDYEYQKQLLFTQDNYAMYNFINRNLDKKNDKVLVVFDNRLYYLEVPSMFENPSIFGHFTNPKLTNIDEIENRMKNEGITHVLINTNWGTYPNLQKEVFNAFIKKKLDLINTKQTEMTIKGLTLYQLI